MLLREKIDLATASDDYKSRGVCKATLSEERWHVVQASSALSHTFSYLNTFFKLLPTSVQLRDQI